MASAADNFNRANGAVGSNWTIASGSGLYIVSNVAFGKSGEAFEHSSWWNANSFGSDQFSEVAITTAADGGGPMVRQQSGVNSCYFLFWNSSSGAIEINKRIAGAYTGLNSGTTSFSAGDVLRLEVSGTNLTCKKNGTTVLTASDSALSGGQPGILCYSFNIGFDNWSGGDLASGTTLTAAAGSYTLTGSTAGLAGKAVAAAGSYALTGSAAALALRHTAGAGTYTLTGTAAAFLAATTLTAAGGSYTLTGSDATFQVGGSFTLFCGSGAYTLTGADAAFPGYEPITPPVQPSTGGGYTGGAVYDTYRLRRKRKRDEIEELIDAVLAPPVPQIPQIPQPAPPALIDLAPKLQAVGLTPPQRKIVKRAIVTDDPDDDEEAIELLLNLLS